MTNQLSKKSQPMILSEEEVNIDNTITQIGSGDSKPHYIGANEEESE